MLTASGGATHRGDFVGVAGITAGHALLVGESGEPAARLAIETNGALRWGDGQSMNFDTTLQRCISNSTEFNLPRLEPGGVTSTNITVTGAAPTDVVAATLSSLGDALIFVSARVAAGSRVLVLFKNEGPAPVDLEMGTLRAAVSKFV